MFFRKCQNYSIIKQGVFAKKYACIFFSVIQTTGKYKLCNFIAFDIGICIIKNIKYSESIVIIFFFRNRVHINKDANLKK